MRASLNVNLLIASHIDPARASESQKTIINPGKSDKPTEEIISAYLHQTPLLDFFQTPLLFSIPLRSRFEHMHIVGGSGHGKTPLLQHLLLHDLEELKNDRAQLSSLTAKET